MAPNATDASAFELVAGIALTLGVIAVLLADYLRNGRSGASLTLGVIVSAFAIPVLWFLLVVPWINAAFVQRIVAP
jgi:hypothetical protein